MNDSYKKRLYTQALSLSAAVLMAVLAQGKAAADQQNSIRARRLPPPGPAATGCSRSSAPGTTRPPPAQWSRMPLQRPPPPPRARPTAPPVPVTRAARRS